MTFLVPLTLFGWIPAVILLFMLLPPRRAVITAFLIAWLFLPMAGYKVKALPDYTKMSATCFGVFVAAAMFDLDRILRFRPKWFDIPVAVFCFSPFITSVLNQINGAGYYDGASMVLTQVVTWGLPYLIGRLYFSDLQGLRELALGVFIGGLIYVPLCWFEIRMSPQLHRIFYGFHQHAFNQTMRDGGFRPMVFMQHGLMVAMWMAMTTLIGFWMWRSRAVQRLWNQPMYVWVGLLGITAVFCKSGYALALLLGGIALLMLSRQLKTRLMVIALMLVPPMFMYVRANGIVNGDWMVDMVRQHVGEERAQSLATRVDAENLLRVRAMERPWFGWGGWGRSRVQDESGKDVVTDSLWIITFGEWGVIGLAGLTLMLLLPMILVCIDYHPRLWLHPAIAPLVAMSLVCVLYMCDHLLNGMVNPIFMLMCGAATMAHAAVPRAAIAPQPVYAGYGPQPRRRMMPRPAFTRERAEPIRRAG
jgi:hypothetical protein